MLCAYSAGPAHAGTEARGATPERRRVADTPHLTAIAGRHAPLHTATDHHHHIIGIGIVGSPHMYM